MERNEFLQHIIAKYDLELTSLVWSLYDFEFEKFSRSNEINQEPFQWRNKNGEDVTILITIKSVPVEYDQDGKPVSWKRLYSDHVKDHSMTPLQMIMGISEASSKWGYEQSTIKKMCQRGELPAVKIGDTWILLRDQEQPQIKSRPKRAGAKREADQTGA